MKLRCKECEGPLEEVDDHYECWLCKRRIDKKTHAELLPFVKNQIPASHGLSRKEALAADAYQPEPYEPGQE